MMDFLEICDFYEEAQVWPAEPRIDARAWLSNFTDAEMPYAEALLKSFFFFNEKMAKSLLRAAFQRISTIVIPDPVNDGQERWERFISETVFSTVDIAFSNPTASGYTTCRWAMQKLDIPRESFLNHTEAIQAIIDGKFKNVVFLDDFIGSGQQFTDTWLEPVRTSRGACAYSTVPIDLGLRAFYAPLVATTYGIQEIVRSCHNISIVPGNLIDERYNAFHPESLIWPPELIPGVEHFLETVSKKAGIQGNWCGFERLGLTISFHHADPDASLPIFYHKGEKWNPLLDRS